MLTEIIEESRECGELAADGGSGQFAVLEMLAPGDDVSARYETKLDRMLRAGEGRKLPNVNFISAAGFGIGDVGEPLKLSRNFSELTELQRRECALGVSRVRVAYHNQVLSHAATPFFPTPLFRHF